jgi:hypothetical protein
MFASNSAAMAAAATFPPGQGSRPEGGYQGPAFDQEKYVDDIPPLFEHLREQAGFSPKLPRYLVITRNQCSLPARFKRWFRA